LGCFPILYTPPAYLGAQQAAQQRLGACVADARRERQPAQRQCRGPVEPPQLQHHPKRRGRRRLLQERSGGLQVRLGGGGGGARAADALGRDEEGRL
jgi:hypothetical protein